MSAKKEKQKRRIEQLADLGFRVPEIVHMEEDRARRIRNQRENKSAVAATLGRLDSERT